jgi:hypothetical protein
MGAIEVGSVWTRRCEFATDDGFNRLVVKGVFEQGEGPDEVCVASANGFGRVLSVTPTDLQASFDLEKPAPPTPPSDLFDTGSGWV